MKIEICSGLEVVGLECLNLALRMRHFKFYSFNNFFDFRKDVAFRKHDFRVRILGSSLDFFASLLPDGIQVFGKG